MGLLDTIKKLQAEYDKLRTACESASGKELDELLKRKLEASRTLNTRKAEAKVKADERGALADGRSASDLAEEIVGKDREIVGLNKQVEDLRNQLAEKRAGVRL